MRPSRPPECTVRSTSYAALRGPVKVVTAMGSSIISVAGSMKALGRPVGSQAMVRRSALSSVRLFWAFSSRSSSAADRARRTHHRSGERDANNGKGYPRSGWLRWQSMRGAPNGEASSCCNGEPGNFGSEMLLFRITATSPTITTEHSPEKKETPWRTSRACFADASARIWRAGPGAPKGPRPRPRQSSRKCNGPTGRPRP